MMSHGYWRNKFQGLRVDWMCGSLKKHKMAELHLASMIPESISISERHALVLSCLLGVGMQRVNMQDTYCIVLNFWESKFREMWFFKILLKYFHEFAV